MTVALQEIRSAEALAALVPEWWGLWRRSSAATPFQAPGWLLPWWKAFAPGDLLGVAARLGEHLVGLALFYVETGPLGRRILPLGISVSDYLDILADDDCADAVCAALVRYFDELPFAWDAWELTELAPPATALRLGAPGGWIDLTDTVSACPVLTLPARGGDIDAAVPARKRRDVRAAWHRARRRGAVEITTTTLDTSGEALAALVALHRARWRSKGEGGVMADPRVQRFHAESIRIMIEAGVARLYTLRIAGRIAGVYYGFHHDCAAYGYLMGFDPEFDFESPGTILIDHAIRQAIGEDAREFHFLRGREKYKYQWGARDRWNRRRVLQRTVAHACAS
jgi:CelD/BcsL family acetyltransferase involved in cellulose biosynthesis